MTNTQKCTHTSHATLTHPETHTQTHTLISANNHKLTNTTLMWLVLIYDPCHNQDKSGTLSQKIFDCILELHPSQQLPHEKYISVLATKFTSPPPLLLSLSPLPALTLDISLSEQKLVAMATIINTSGMVIWCAHAQMAERRHTHGRTSAHVPTKQTNNIHM